MSRTQGRLGLSEILHGLCENVYFQPPPTVQMKYPCIVYGKKTIGVTYADDTPYSLDECYQVTYIDPDPDSTVPMEIAKLQMCSMDTCFTSDNLNHSVFTLYY